MFSPDYAADLIAINALTRELQRLLTEGETRSAKVAVAAIINSACNISAWCVIEEARIAEARHKRAQFVNQELVTV